MSAGDVPDRPPLVSVLIPVRNEARYIERALHSVQRQTLRRWEAVVVDDGSSDTTAERVRRLAREDARIRLVANDGQGFTQALNHGLGLVRAPLVARLDADDRSLRARLARQVAELDANPSAVAVGTYGLRVNEWGVPLAPLRTGPVGREGYAAARAARQPINLTHPSVMFRAPAVRAVGGYDEDYYPSDDYALWNRLADVGEVYAIPDLLTLYTLRSSRGISARATIDQERMHRRIELEVARGERFGSLEAFSAETAAGPDRERQHEAWRAVAARRQVMRHLANGHVLRAWRSRGPLRLDRETLASAARRVLRG